MPREYFCRECGYVLFVTDGDPAEFVCSNVSCTVTYGAVYDLASGAWVPSGS